MKKQLVEKVDNVYDQLRKKLKKGQSFINSKGVVFTCLEWKGPKFFTARYTFKLNEKVYRGGDLHVEVAICCFNRVPNPKTLSIEEIGISQLMNISELWRADNKNFLFSKSFCEKLVICQSNSNRSHCSAENRNREIRITGELTILDMVTFETPIDQALQN